MADIRRGSGNQAARECTSERSSSGNEGTCADSERALGEKQRAKSQHKPAQDKVTDPSRITRSSLAKPREWRRFRTTETPLHYLGPPVLSEAVGSFEGSRP